MAAPRKCPDELRERAQPYGAWGFNRTLRRGSAGNRWLHPSCHQVKNDPRPVLANLIPDRLQPKTSCWFHVGVHPPRLSAKRYG